MEIKSAHSRCSIDIEMKINIILITIEPIYLAVKETELESIQIKTKQNKKSYRINSLRCADATARVCMYFGDSNQRRERVSFAVLFGALDGRQSIN